MAELGVVQPCVPLRTCGGFRAFSMTSAGRCTDFAKSGNDNRFAGYGVDVAEHQAPSTAAREAYRIARMWCGWVAVLASHWPQDMQPRPPRRARSAAPHGQRALALQRWLGLHMALHRLVVAESVRVVFVWAQGVFSCRPRRHRGSERANFLGPVALPQVREQ